MSGRERNHYCFTAPASHFASPDNRIDRIIDAFHNYIRLQRKNELERSVVAEKNNRVNRFKAGEHVRAICFVPNRPRGTLQSSHGVVTVYSDDERIAASARLSENIDVTGMNQIEHAVCEDNLARDVLPPAAGFFPRQDFLDWRAGAQKEFSIDGRRWIVREWLKGSFIS